MCPITQMRLKLERWYLSGQQEYTTTNYFRALKVVKERLPPRVGAACLRTAWNGWCTSRRFQQSGRCVFKCGAYFQEDSIEHYAGCSMCIEFLRNQLRYQGPIDKGHLIVLGCNTSLRSQEDICRLALWNYVVYKAYNFLRRSNRDVTCQDIQNLWKGYLREVGSTGCAKEIIECGWDRKFRFAGQASSTPDDDDDWS